MNQVVNFLSLLSVNEEQGGVKRMLGVCSEFERIARVVLDKGDKGSRHKRKTSKATNAENGTIPETPQQIPQKRSAPAAPQQKSSTTPQSSPYTSNLTSDGPQVPFNPNLNTFSPTVPNMNLPMDFSNTPEFANMMNTPSSNPNGGGAVDDSNLNIQDMNQFPTDNPSSALNLGAFQQPFVPQDMWNMPMTLEWDWSEMNTDGFGAAGQGQEQAGMDGNGNGQA